jgi:aryl-alcohol dehydrogenase-like predicted oxidoreductase
VGRVEAIAREKGVTAGQLALAWTIAQEGVVPIPGTKRVRFLEENVAAASVVLSEDDLRRLDDVAAPENVGGPRYADMSTIDR